MSHPEKPVDSLAELWKTQEVVPMEITIDAVKVKASKLEKTVRWRNVREWVACAVVAPWFGWMALAAPNLVVQVGALEVVLAAFYVAYRLYRDGRTRQAPDPSLNTVAYLTAYQDELLHQADLLQQVPVWYVGPLALGVFIISAGWILEDVRAGRPITGRLIYLGAVILLMVGISYLNLRAARKLRQEASPFDASRE